MKFWLSLMTVPELDQLPAIARAAEAAGFHGVMYGEHLAMPTQIKSKYPYTEDGEIFWSMDIPWPDPWIALSIMAAATTRLHIASNIYLAALRDPYTAAKSVGTAACFFEDRVTCGVSVGWIKEEYALVNVDFHTRGKRLDEMLDVMRLLWSGEVVSHHGGFFDFDQVIMRPAPRHKPRIWVGGGSDGAMRRAARQDGWLGLPLTVEQTLPVIEKLKRMRTEQGIRPEGFSTCLSVAEPLTQMAIDRLMQAGADNISAMPWMPSPWDVQRWIDEGDDVRELAVKEKAIARFGESVIAKLGAPK